MRFSRISAVFTLLIAAAALVRADDSAVVVLTKDNFKSVVSDDGRIVLVKFFAPWCGHCKAMAPEYVKAAEELKDNDKVVLAEVDCTEERDLCQDHDVNGYPTVKAFKDGKTFEYQGARKTDAFVSFLKKRTLPALSKVEHDALETFIKSDKVVVVGFYDDDEADHKDEHEVLSNVAKELSEQLVFGYAEDVKSAEAHGVKRPGMALFKQFDEGKVVYDGKFTVDDIKTFIKENKTPVLDEIGPENFMSYVDSGLPLAYLFLDDDDDRTKHQDLIKPIAKEFKGKMNFVWIDASKYSGHAGNLNLEEKWPAFAIQEPKAQTKFPLDQEQKLSADAVRDFANKYLKGELKPSIKSEPIPEKNDEPVKIVVANQFDELVMDKSKDVLIEFYAPWCGHCKKIAPIYEKVGAKYAAHSDKVIIAKMDATTNDIPPSAGFSISGFPTIKLVKAGTNEAVEYDGDRTYESFIKFIDENATNKITFEDAESKEKDTAQEKEKPQEEKKKEHDEL